MFCSEALPPYYRWDFSLLSAVSPPFHLCGSLVIPHTISSHPTSQTTHSHTTYTPALHTAPPHPIPFNIISRSPSTQPHPLPFQLSPFHPSPRNLIPSHPTPSRQYLANPTGRVWWLSASRSSSSACLALSVRLLSLSHARRARPLPRPPHSYHNQHSSTSRPVHGDGEENGDFRLEPGLHPTHNGVHDVLLVHRRREHCRGVQFAPFCSVAIGTQPYAVSASLFG